MPNIALLGGKPAWLLQGASADLDFVNSRGWASGSSGLASLTSTSRASTGLAQGADGQWSSFANNALRMTNQGVLIEDSRTNLFLNSAAPVTQTVTVVNGSTYTVSVYGNASVVLTGATTGTVTQGSPQTFAAGTTSLVCTVSGAGGTFQNVNVELGAFATSPIVTTGSTATRATDIITLQGNALTAALNSHAARTETNMSEGLASSAGYIVNLGGLSGSQSLFLSSVLTSLRLFDGTNTVAATIGGGGTTAGLVKAAFGYDNATITALANGGTKTSGVSVWATPASSPVYLGNLPAGSRSMNGYLRRLTFSNVKGQFDGLTQ